MIRRATAPAALRAAHADGRPTRILHIGRHAADVERVRHHLQGHGARFVLDGTLTLGDCLDRLAAEPFDAVLLDERASDASAPEVLRVLRARKLGIPVILLLREADEWAALDAVKTGVHDYLIKRAADLGRLPLVLGHATEHHRLREEREEFAAISRFLVTASGRLDVGDVLEAAVRAARDLLGTDCNVVFLLENGGTLVPRAGTGLDSAALADVRLPAGAGLWRDMLAIGAPRRLDRLALSGPWTLPLAGLDSLLAIPLLTRERRVGLLLAGSTENRALGRSDDASVRALADHVAAAIENARVFEHLLHAERLSTVGRMVASVAHELNNPLSVIAGTLDLMRRDVVSDRLAERLTRVSTQAERATKIVATLLALSRKRPPRRRPVNVTELLVGTLDLAGYDLKHARVVVERDFAEALPAVLADPDQLQQVFANLLLNAAQAMGGASGSGILAVSAGRDPEGGGVQIAIRDNGPGINPEHLPHIFEPFFTTKGEGQGTGLGLAICQRIIENHGGRITVASQPGAETVFTVTLPVVSVSDGAGAPRGTADAPGDAMDVLLVEDEPLVGEMLAEILALGGYQVDRAANGREALTQLATHAYALIVSDVRMPDLDGQAFYEELRRQNPTLARRVIFVTGDVMSPDTRRFLDETGVLYLEKPFGAEDLTTLARRALAR